MSADKQNFRFDAVLCGAVEPSELERTDASKSGEKSQIYRHNRANRNRKVLENFKKAVRTYLKFSTTFLDYYSHRAVSIIAVMTLDLHVALSSKDRSFSVKVNLNCTKQYIKACKSTPSEPYYLSSIGIVGL